MAKKNRNQNRTSQKLITQKEYLLLEDFAGIEIESGMRSTELPLFLTALILPLSLTPELPVNFYYSIEKPRFPTPGFLSLQITG